MQVFLADSLSFDYPKVSSISCNTSSDDGYLETSFSVTERSEKIGHTVTLRTYQSAHHDGGSFSSQDLLYDGSPIFQMSSTISRDGIYKANVTWADLVKGGSHANYTITANGNIMGSIDDQTFTPFVAINASKATFSDGKPLPVLFVSDTINLTMSDVAPRMASTMKLCRPTDSGFVFGPQV
jgi:hypothetical protein